MSPMKARAASSALILGTLGASAFAVAFVSGFGEMVGYALRLVSGYAADKTRSYWTLTIIGYA